MTRLANQNSTREMSLRSLLAPIHAELDRVEEILRKELRSDFPFVDELVRYGC